MHGTPFRPAALILCAAFLVLIPAFVLTRINDHGARILMLGPFSSGKVEIVLFALSPGLLGLSFVVLVTAAAFRCERRWLDLLLGLLMGLVWLAAIPFWGLVSAVAALTYDDEPDIHGFSVSGEKYLLTSQPQYDPSQVRIELFRKQRLVYSRTEPGWGEFEIAPASVGRGEFTVVRSRGRAWIVFGNTRLEIPSP